MAVEVNDKTYFIVAGSTFADAEAGLSKVTDTPGVLRLAKKPAEDVKDKSVAIAATDSLIFYPQANSLMACIMSPCA